MPGMTGLELAAQLQKIRSDLPIIIMTGYGENITDETQRHYHINHIIGKPVMVKELAVTIHDVLQKIPR